MVKTKKRKKYSRMHGRKMGTAGHGARKKGKGNGHRGGVGMAGSGKRADHKKTLLTKLYGNDYMGKQGITSKGTERDKRDRINLYEIQSKYKPGKLDLSTYKVLGEGEIKDKFIITALEASKSAIEKIKKAGGEITVLKKKVEKKPKVEKVKVVAPPVVEKPKVEKAPKVKKVKIQDREESLRSASRSTKK